jgi:capsule polysaccharide export protein KpsE/RkpR
MAKNNTASIIKTFIAIAVIIIIIGYTLFNSRLFIKGPQIIIDSPENGAVISDKPLINISGKAINISHIEINGRQIYIEENDAFSESLLLDSGYNIIQITAEDKFGREVKQVLQLAYNGPKQTPAIEEEDIAETEEVDADAATSTTLDNI